MNHNEQQKQEEFIVIQHFMEHYKDFPKGKLQRSESPDFILYTSPKYSIGIELTQLHHHQEFSIELIKELIEKKEEKANVYKLKNLNELWLLVYMDSIEQKDKQKLGNQFKIIKSPKGFNKLFFIEFFSNWIVEV